MTDKKTVLSFASKAGYTISRGRMKPSRLSGGIVCILTLLLGAAITHGADQTDPVLVKEAWHVSSAPAKTGIPKRTLVDANGDVLVAGVTSQPGAGFSNVWVAKYSGATGAVIWETTAFVGSTRDAAIDSLLDGEAIQQRGRFDRCAHHKLIEEWAGEGKRKPFEPGDFAGCVVGFLRGLLGGFLDAATAHCFEVNRGS